MSDSLQSMLVEPVFLRDLRHSDEQVRLAAQERFAAGYTQGGRSGFGAIAVLRSDNLFRWELLEENQRFLDEAFSPEVWSKLQAAGRSKDGQMGTTDIGEERYRGHVRKNMNRYLHVTTGGKPEVINTLRAEPAFLKLGLGMHELARQAAYALERPCGQPMGFLERQLTMAEDSFTTYRLLDYPAGGTIEPHVDSCGITVVKFEPGVRAERGGQWYELVLDELKGAGDEDYVVFLINLGRTGSMWLTGDVQLATKHSVVTPRPRRTFALFVHLDTSATWKRDVNAGRPSSNDKAGDLVSKVALEDFVGFGVASSRPPSS